MNYYNDEPTPDVVTCRQCNRDFYDGTTDAWCIYDNDICNDCYAKSEE